MTITFETKVWEKDWEIILKTSRLKNMIERCHYGFKERVLYINNVRNFKEVSSFAKDLVKNGVISKYIEVAEYEDAALKFFSLSREKLGNGYYYSIAELVSIYLTNSKYLLHFSGDSIVAPRTTKDWLQSGIRTLEDNPSIKVFNLTWNGRYKEAKKESTSEDKQNFYGYGFSDQMYLIRTEEFKKNIYEYFDAASKRYPIYGGELFEKRVDSWMRQNQFLRATYKHGSYIHQNFTKNSLKRKISIYLNRPNLFKEK